MRIVFYTDVQLSGQTPLHRVDDYQGALVAKLNEVYSEARRRNADFVVCGGDLFNTTDYKAFRPVRFLWGASSPGRGRTDPEH